MVTDKKSRIRRRICIVRGTVRIWFSRSRSIPKCHESGHCKKDWILICTNYFQSAKILLCHVFLKSLDHYVPVYCDAQEDTIGTPKPNKKNNSVNVYYVAYYTVVNQAELTQWHNNGQDMENHESVVGGNSTALLHDCAWRYMVQAAFA